MGREEQRAKGKLIKQCSRRLTLRWQKWLRGFLGMKMSNRGFGAAGVPAIHKSLLLSSPLKVAATHRGFVCPAMLCFGGGGGEADFFFLMEHKKRIEVLVWADSGCN